MNKKIRLIGFRNALYAGQLKQNSKAVQNPQGVSILIDDMFLTCLSNWSTDQSNSLTKPKGASILLYPHRQVLYTQQYPKNSKLTAFWCYIVPQFKIFGFGQNQNIAVLHKGGSIISKSKIVAENQVQNIQEYTYSNQQQKWNKIQEILGNKISSQNRSLKQFINYYFVNILKNQQNDNFINVKVKGTQQIYGISCGKQVLAFCLKDDTITSTGYYKNFDTNKIMSFGRIYRDQVNSTAYKIQQGNFQNQQLFCFQFTDRRPQESYKYSRNYFRQSSLFYNQFLQLNDADQIYKKLDKLTKQYLLNIGSRYGQRIIEGTQRGSTYKKQNKRDVQIRRSQYLQKQESHINRQYNLLQAKQAIQSQISKKKFNTDRNKVGFYTQSYQDQNSDRDSKYKSSIPSKTIQQKSNTGIDKLQRSPIKTSPRKYQYQYNQQNLESIKQDAAMIRPKRHYANTINQFTLYPNPTIQRQRIQLQRIQHDLQLQKIQRQKIKSLIQYQKQKQVQLKLRLLRQRDKENQIQKQLLLQKNLVLQKLPTFGQIIYYQNPSQPVINARQTNKFDTNFQKRAQAVNLSPNNLLFRRKYMNNYKYIEQRELQLKEGERYKQTRNFTKRNILTSTLSPVNKLYPEPESDKKQSASKSPLGTRRNWITTARRNYTYLE